MDNERLEQNGRRPEGEFAVKNKKTYSLIAKIVCIIAAFLVWLYAANNDTSVQKKTFDSIPVTVENSSESLLSVYTGYNSTVDVTVTGKSTDIRRLTEDDIRASVDISAITEAGNYKLPVEIQLPNGIELAEKNPDTLNLYIDNKTSVIVPVSVKLTNTAIVSGYELGKEILDREVVTVTGPEAVLEDIAEARLSVSLGRVNASMTYTGPIVLMDKNGMPIDNPYVRADVTDVTVKFPVYLTKDIPLSVSYKNGFWNPGNVSVLITPSSIRVRGEVEKVEALESVQLAVLDEKQLAAYDSTLIRPFVVLDEGLENVDNVDSVIVQITQLGTTLKSVTLNRFHISAPDNISYRLINEAVTVSLRVPDEYADSLNSEYIDGHLDLEKLVGTDGVVAVPVTITVNGPYQGIIYEVGEYTVLVEVSTGDLRESTAEAR